jgi:hypothetical protein
VWFLRENTAPAVKHAEKNPDVKKEKTVTDLSEGNV